MEWRKSYELLVGVAAQVALVSAAAVVVGLATQRAHRTDLVRCPKRVLAYVGEGW